MTLVLIGECDCVTSGAFWSDSLEVPLPALPNAPTSSGPWFSRNAEFSCFPQTVPNLSTSSTVAFELRAGCPVPTCCLPVSNQTRSCAFLMFSDVTSSPSATTFIFKRKVLLIFLGTASGGGAFGTLTAVSAPAKRAGRTREKLHLSQQNAPSRQVSSVT